MALFGLLPGGLLAAILLFLNAIAILNEERFLSKSACSEARPFTQRLSLLRLPVGLQFNNDFSSGLSGSKSLKSQALGVHNAGSFMRRASLPSSVAFHSHVWAVPLTIVNAVVIVAKLLFG